MPDLDRMVGGMRCREVLTALPDYVDGTLDPETLQRVRAHVSGCDVCEKFGGEYAALVAALRAGMSGDAGDDAVRARLHRRLTAEWSGQGG
jgi:anti-sigma factor RsiW